MKAVVLSLCIGMAAGHGAVVNPMPRNGVDRDLSPWNGPVPPHPPSVESDTGWCPVPDKTGKVSGQNGQACFWFSNGCAIGCDECDGTSRGPIPISKDPKWLHKFNICPNNTAKALVCDPKYRTVNTDAECNGPKDIYQFSPWRAPGSAPVFDSCGMAGGHLPPNGGFGGIYVNTTHAKLGDKGSEVLPQMPPQATWTAGTSVEVSWTIEANHGGGYQYRLAPLGAALTEETFQKMPLEFVGQQTLQWGGPSGTRVNFNGTYVSEGTSPAGSTWVVNPIPRNDWTGKGFPPHCDTTKLDCQGMTDGSSAVPDLEIIDRVLIPKDLAPGKYVLGWRWDCEESNQIWQSCSDIEVISP